MKPLASSPLRPPVLCGLVLGFITLAASEGLAQYYWDGGSFLNKKWTTAGNWSPSGAPPLNSGAAIVFSSAGIGEPTSFLDATHTLSSLDFLSSASWVIEPQNGAVLNINSGGIRQASTGVTRIYAPINVTASSTWDIDAAAIEIHQPVTVASSSHTLTLNADNGMSARLFGGGVGSDVSNYFGIALSGSGNLVKTGLGELVLGGELALTGSITVSQGVLRFEEFEANEWLGPTELTNHALGSSQSVSIATGATFDLNGNVASLGSLTGGGLMKVRMGHLRLNTFTATTFNGDFDLVISTETPPAGTTGRGRIIKNSPATFTWDPDFTAWSISGDVEVINGIFRLSGGSGLGSLSKLIMTGGTFDFNGVSDTIATIEGPGAITLGAAHLTVGAANVNFTYSGVISGSGALTKTGTGTLFLQGANSYTGNTLVQGGVLELGSSQRISDGSLVDIASAGTLRLGPVSGSTGYSETVGAISGSGLINLKAGVLTAGGNNSSTTFSGAISGNGGSLVKAGTGTLTLTGLNTYNGGTAVSAGTLAGNPSRSFPGALANEGTVLFTPVVANSITYPSGQISGMSGAGTFRVADGFTLGISNATNTGPLEIESGGVVTGAANGLSDTARVNLMTGGTLDYAPAASDQIGSLIGGGNVEMDGGTLTVGSDNTSHTFSGGFSGGGFAKTGTGTMTLSGTGLVNPSAITVSGGALSLRAGVVTGAVPITNNAHLVLSWSSAVEASFNVTGSGTAEKINSGQLDLTGSIASTGLFTLNGGTVRIGTGGGPADHIGDNTPLLVGSSSTARFINTAETIGPLSGTGSVVLETHNLTVNSANLGTTVSFGGVISGTGALTLAGPGTQVLTGVNSFVSTFPDGRGVTVSGGVLQVGSDASLGGVDLGGFRHGVQVLDGGTLRLGSGFTSARSLSLGTLGGALCQLDTGSTNATWNGTVSGAGTLVKIGSGILTLSGASTRTGATHVNEGSLVLGASGLLPDGGTVNLLTAGTLQLNGNSETIGDLAGSGTVQLGGGSLTVSPASSTTFNGVITGSGSVTKSGTGTFTLSKVQTWAGPLSVTGGTLAISASERLPDTLPLSLSSTATFSLGGFAETVGTVSGTGKISLGGGTFGFGADDGSFDFEPSLVSPASVSGSLRKLGAGTVVLRSAWTSPTVSLAVDSGTLALGSAARIGDASPVAVAVGAVLDLAGFSEMVGPLSGSGTVAPGAGSLTVSVSASQGSPVFSGTISGGVGLTKTGDGVWTLSGAATHTGDTGVTAGTLRLGADSALPAATALSLSSGATLDLDGRFLAIGSLAGAGTLHLGAGGLFLTGGNDSSTTYSGVVTGSGAFVKNGSGTLTLSGTQTYTGGFQVNGGTVAFISGGNLGSGSIGLDGGALRWLSGASVDLSPRLLALGFSGGTFDLSTGVQVDFAQPVSGGGVMRKKGNGTLTFSASNPFGGDTVVEDGTLIVNGACGSSPLQVLTGATLAGQGTVGSLVSSGIVSPGNGTGTLSVSGGASLTGGTLHIGLSGAANGHLAVSGNLDLSGVALSVDPAPAASQQASRVIATYGGTLTGIFASVPEGYYARYHQGALSNQIVLERTAAASLADWAELNGLDPLTTGAPLADPDGDGVPNLHEYAFATDPTDGTSGSRPLVYNGSVSGGGTLISNGGASLVLENGEYRGIFIRRSVYLGGDLTYLPQFSKDLVTWDESAPGIEPVVVLADDGLGYQVVAVQFPAPSYDAATRRFFRVRVMLTP